MTNLIFDFDGTLHDTIRIYAPAFREAYNYLVSKGYAQARDWRDEEISSWLGYKSKDMWDAFMPDLPDWEKETCSGIIGAEMLAAITADKAQLYDGAAEMLCQLSQENYRLIFLSNCKTSYMEACIRQFSLGNYFSAFYCTEQYGFLPKHDIFREINRKYDGDFIIIGDRYMDMEIAETSALPSIGCLYGYGSQEELKTATVIVNSVSEISNTVSTLTEITH